LEQIILTAARFVNKASGIDRALRSEVNLTNNITDVETWSDAMDGTRKLSGTIDDLRPKLSAALSVVSDSEVQEEVVRRILPFMHIDPAQDEFRTVHRHVFSEKYYVIHNSDLGLLEESATVAVTLLAGLPEPSAVLSGLIVFLFQYRKGGADVDGIDGRILLTLKGAGPHGLDPTEIHAKLEVSDEITQEQLLERLEGMKQCICRDGTEKAFVACRDSKWRAIDI